jgi:hypothetical protein
MKQSTMCGLAIVLVAYGIVAYRFRPSPMGVSSMCVIVIATSIHRIPPVVLPDHS